MRIPDSKIDEIRAASDIVDIISSSVRLKKRGKNYLGLCPFHTEKTPSFSVSSEKQMFHCFGCGVGGNVFTFIMKIQKVPFPEAVGILAERVGITLPQDGGPGESAHEALYDACRRAGMHYYENLFSSAEGGLGLEYFRKRGFAEETIKGFGLGYARNSWDDLLRFAREQGVEPSTLERAGLAVRRDDGSGYYDRFRGRAMFPIFSPSGRAIGFGARKLREDDPLAKYLNSPETPVFDKSRILYGLNMSKEAIRTLEFAVIVEGYADLISVYQSGIENIVATSGTALTEDQIRLLGRYTRNITLVYDADSAGSKAMMRGVDLIMEQGLDVRVAGLPEGEDPDSFVRKNGRKAFEDLLSASASFLDFKVERFRAAGHFATPEGQTRAVRSIIQTIARVQDELKRNLYVKHLAERHGIYESVLFRELERQLSQQRTAPPVRPSPEASVQAPPSDRVPGSEVLPQVERDLLKVMLENGPRIIRSVLDQFPAQEFTSAQARKVIAVMEKVASTGQPWDPASVLDRFTEDDLRRFITDLLFNQYDISAGWSEQGSAPEEVDPERIVEACVGIKRREKIDAAIRENQNEMSAATARGEDLTPFLQKHRELMGKKQGLRKQQAE